MRCTELFTNFYDQVLSFEILHERIYRFARDAQHIHNVSDPQCPEFRIVSSMEIPNDASSILRTRFDSTGGRGACA
jgi:hypothetical protein